MDKQNGGTNDPRTSRISGPAETLEIEQTENRRSSGSGNPFRVCFGWIDHTEDQWKQQAGIVDGARRVECRVSIYLLVC